LYQIKGELGSSVQQILSVYRPYRLHLRGLSYQGLVIAIVFDTTLSDTIDISHSEAEEEEALISHAKLN
jgi:hypothetical protein